MAQLTSQAGVIWILENFSARATNYYLKRGVVCVSIQVLGLGQSILIFQAEGSHLNDMYNRFTVEPFYHHTQKPLADQIVSGIYRAVVWI